MRFVGLDLAWGSNGGTGLCFVDENKIVESGFARTDEEIIERLRPVTSEPCLVAIDAPLVISNKTGRRECERAISRCFGKHHAGAHSSNLGMPAFAHGSRGARLCSQLNLEMDPEITPLVPTRRAIEVYPHPALVALLALPLTLKYKAKRGRSIGQRLAAFEVLCELLESLRDATPRLQVRNPRWVRIREMLKNTTPGRRTGSARGRARCLHLRVHRTLLLDPWERSLSSGRQRFGRIHRNAGESRSRPHARCDWTGAVTVLAVGHGK